MKALLSVLLLVMMAMSYFREPLEYELMPMPDEKMSKEDKKNSKLAEAYYVAENYTEAISIYESLIEKYPSDIFFKFKAGVCYLYGPKNLERSLDLLTEVEELAPEYLLVNYYLGKVYHLEYKFDEAIEKFDAFLRDRAMDPVERMKCKRYIEFCENAKYLMAHKQHKKIQNLGAPVNSAGDDYMPLLTGDESTLLFTHLGSRSTGGKLDGKGKPSENGNYTEDIFISKNVNNRWTAPESVGTGINEKSSEAGISLSVDGQTMLVFKSGEKHQADLLISKLKGADWLEPQVIPGDVNSKSWEGSGALSPDGQTLYFVSDRPEGKGGTDIYIASKMPDGTWGKIKNLGGKINTKYDEDTPYLQADGKTLYFSSMGHNSMGLFDVFYSRLEEGKWTDAQNMGFPISTVSDDRNYVVSADGHRGYFASEMEGGMGGMDIYMVTPGVPDVLPVVGLIHGRVTLDGQSIQAEIALFDKESEELLSTHSSNGYTGLFALVINQDHIYKMEVSIAGQEPHVEVFDGTSLHHFVDIRHEFKFTTPEFKNLMGGVESELLQPELNSAIALQDQIQEEAIKDAILEHGDDEEKGVDYEVVDSRGSKEFFPTLNKANKRMGELAKRGELAEVIVQDHGQEKDLEVFFYDEFEKEAIKLDKAYHSHPADSALDATATIVNRYRKPTIATIVLNDAIKIQKIDEPTADLFNEDAAILMDPAPITIDEQEVLLHKARLTAKVEAPHFEEQADEVDTREPVLIPELVVQSELPMEEEPVVKLLDPLIEQVVQKFEEATATSVMMDLSAFVGKNLNDSIIYKAFIELVSNYAHPDMEFEVQIGAYKHPENFKYPHLRNFGSAETRAFSDAITRFTMGKFNTIGRAEKLRVRIQKAGQFDAWITPYYKGERYLMHELIDANFYSGVN